MNFDLAFDRIVPLDGHYHSGDGAAGSEQKFGLKKRDFLAEDIKGLTREAARGLYFTGVWVPAGCSIAPDQIRFHLFAAAAVSGPGMATRMLQRALGVKETGELSILDLRAMAGQHPAQLAAHFTAHHLLHLVCQTDWSDEGAGWVRHVADNMLEI